MKKIKDKNAKIQASNNEKKAKAKGFSSHTAYQTFKSAAEHDGKERANKRLRKKELDRIEKEAFDDKIQGRSGKYHKYQKKVIKGIQAVNSGAQEYNKIMTEFKSLGGGNTMPKQSWPRKSKRKPQKKKSKSKKPKHQPNFWDQFM